MGLLRCINQMSRRRFFAPPDAFNKHSVTLTGDEAKHLREVLRLKVGDDVFVFDGTGKEFRCKVTSARRDVTLLEIDEQVEPARPESPLQLTLAVALLKGEKFDLVVQKATELGVTQILPVTTQHADIRLRDSADAEKRIKRWQRIALEAAKQSGRSMVPNVATPTSFTSLITEEDESVRIMFSERDGSGLNTVVAGDLTAGRCTVLVGSEGGWSDEEIVMARTNGWQIVTLGGRILRAETAAITAMVLMQHQLGDLR